MRKARLAYDMDTALVDEQWQKLKDFLSGKLSDDDMQVVEDICQNGGDAPTAPPSGASDAARPRPAPAATSGARPVTYDIKSFPNSGRLK